MSKDQFYRTPKPINQFTLLEQNDIADQQQKLRKAINATKIRAINRLVHIDDDESYLAYKPKSQARSNIWSSPGQKFEEGYSGENNTKQTNSAYLLLNEDCAGSCYSNLGEVEHSHKIKSKRQVVSTINSLQNEDMLPSPVKRLKNLKIDQVYSHTQKREPSMSSEVSLVGRRSNEKMKLSHQQVFAVVNISSPQKSQQSITTRESVGERLDFTASSHQNLNSYNNYCASCDDFMSVGQHICVRKLYSLEQISKSLQRISLMIEQTKLTKYKQLPDLINNTNKLHELKVFFDFLKKTKNNLILLPEEWNQWEEIVLKRLVNVCGKKISLVI